MSGMATSCVWHERIAAWLRWKCCGWHRALHRVNLGTGLNLQPESVTRIHELFFGIVNGIIALYPSSDDRKGREYRRKCQCGTRMRRQYYFLVVEPKQRDGVRSIVVDANLNCRWASCKQKGNGNDEDGEDSR